MQTTLSLYTVLFSVQNVLVKFSFLHLAITLCDFPLCVVWQHTSKEKLAVSVIENSQAWREKQVQEESGSNKVTQEREREATRLEE